MLSLGFSGAGSVFVAPAKAGAQMPPLVDGQMALDSGLCRNDERAIILCPDFFEHRLSVWGLAA